MIAMFGVRKVLFAAPVLAALAAVGALARPASEVPADAAVAACASEAVEAAVEVVDAVAEVDVAEVDVVDVLDADEVSLVVSNCTYYNNAAHTTIVGQFGYDCCNNLVKWGRKTAFSECGGCFPCVPPPR